MDLSFETRRETLIVYLQVDRLDVSNAAAFKKRVMAELVARDEGSTAGVTDASSGDTEAKSGIADGAAAVDAGKPSLRMVGIDLSTIRFMDSSALGALVAIKKRLGPDRPVALWSLSPHVETLFEVTQLNRVFALVGDEQAAFALLQ
jgi:hypothetical protein